MMEGMLTVLAALGESGSLQSVLSCSPKWSWREGGGAGYKTGRRVWEWGSGKGLWSRGWRWAEFKLKAAECDCEPRVSWGGALMQTEHREFWCGVRWSEWALAGWQSLHTWVWVKEESTVSGLLKKTGRTLQSALLLLWGGSAKSYGTNGEYTGCCHCSAHKYHSKDPPVK